MSSTDHDSPSVSVDDGDGVRVVSLGGEHDVSTVDRMAAACEGPPMPTVFDLTAATFIDSSVIAELLAAHTVSHTHGFAIAVNPGSYVERVLDLCLLSTVVPILDDRTTAIRVATATMHA